MLRHVLHRNVVLLGNMLTKGRTMKEHNGYWNMIECEHGGRWVEWINNELGEEYQECHNNDFCNAAGHISPYDYHMLPNYHNFPSFSPGKTGVHRIHIVGQTSDQNEIENWFNLN